MNPGLKYKAANTTIVIADIIAKMRMINGIYLFMIILLFDDKKLDFMII